MPSNETWHPDYPRLRRPMSGHVNTRTSRKQKVRRSVAASRRRGELDLGDVVKENRPTWWTKNPDMGNENRQMFVRLPTGALRNSCFVSPKTFSWNKTSYVVTCVKTPVLLTTKFGHDVRGKRFSTHGTREQRPENISYWNKSKQAPAENRKCLFFVAGRRIELRTS